jgi:hypothetical protein
VPRRTAPVKPDPAEPVIAGRRCGLLVAVPSTRQARAHQKQKKMARIAFSQFSVAVTTAGSHVIVASDSSRPACIANRGRSLKLRGVSFISPIVAQLVVTTGSNAGEAID